jgi:hypothetical protein
MKKLLVMLMVLSMASLVNAAVKINVDMGANTELAAGDTAAISIVATDEQSPSDLYLFVTDGSLGTVSSGKVIWPDFSSTVGDITLHEGAGDPYVDTVRQYGWLDATQTYYISLIGSTAPPLVMNGTVVDGIIYHAEIAGDSTVILGSVVDDGQGSYLIAVSDTVVIHQVPEPMTMAMLGLGGLLLRRRIIF